jgi:hypothetical protein
MFTNDNFTVEGLQFQRQARGGVVLDGGVIPRALFFTDDVEFPLGIENGKTYKLEFKINHIEDGGMIFFRPFYNSSVVQSPQFLHGDEGIHSWEFTADADSNVMQLFGGSSHLAVVTQVVLTEVPEEEE